MLLRRDTKGERGFILDYMIFILCELLSELLCSPYFYKGEEFFVPWLTSLGLDRRHSSASSEPLSLPPSLSLSPVSGGQVSEPVHARQAVCHEATLPLLLVR